ncbi:MAG: mechanosensitive ion channel [Fluviicola sp.]|nr:mechanosensitive ion channel [Fluviicola sp.]
MDQINAFLEFEIFHFKEHSLTVFEVVAVLLIFICTKIVLRLIEKAVHRKSKINKLDEGSSYALFQLIKYILWVVAVVFMLEAVNIEAGLILAGSAALLVGIGLGLQQTFNDILSGVILLYEKSVKVGDILDVDGEVVIIQEIGLRASKGLSRRDISIMLPNSLITTSKVVNWSHQARKTRFSLDVGVAYGSDVDLVISILEESAKEHPDVLKGGLVEGRLLDFGNSSLDFRILFCSENIFLIEKVKSDIRRTISRKFNENKITIPFPQVDLHLKSKLE